MVKNPLTSKTNWLGILLIVVAVLDFAGASPLFQEYSEYILFGSGVATLVLRQMTKLPTSMRAKMQAKDIMR